MNNVTLSIIIAFVAAIVSVGAVYMIIRTIAKGARKEAELVIKDIHKAFDKLDVMLRELKGEIK